MNGRKHTNNHWRISDHRSYRTAKGPFQSLKPLMSEEEPCIIGVVPVFCDLSSFSGREASRL